MAIFYLTRRRHLGLAALVVVLVALRRLASFPLHLLRGVRLVAALLRRLAGLLRLVFQLRLEEDKDKIIKFFFFFFTFFP